MSEKGREEKVFVVIAHHRSRISGQIMSSIVYIARELTEALSAARCVEGLGYTIRDVGLGISIDAYGVGDYCPADDRIISSGELPPNTIAHVSWLNGFSIEFSSWAMTALAPYQLRDERLFWASR
jgi:hypothetical protein